MKVCPGHRPTPDFSTPRGGAGRWSGRHRQRGVAAIEFALLFLLGVLPLLLLTFSGVMIFAARQSLDLAAADGARAALRYQPSTAARLAQATSVAGQRMQWLLDFSSTSAAQAVQSTQAPCLSDAGITCVTVTTSYDYDAHPFLPGTAQVYGWIIGSNLQSSATIQLPPGP